MATDLIEHEEEEFGTAGLRGKVTRGLRWKLLSQVCGQVSQSGTAILLAHLLAPRVFGVAGMAIVFSGFAGILTDLSLGAALVQRRVLTDVDRSTVFWTTVAGGFVWAAVGVAISPLVASFFSTPEVARLWAAVSVGFLITALGQTQNAILTREMRFRSLELRQIVATVAGSITAIVLALAGFGPWAIVGQSLASYAVSSALLWTVSSWRPQFVFSLDSLRELGSFGFKAFAARILVYVNYNGDNLLVGRYLGSEALGVYSVAYNIMFLPLSRVSAPISQVLYAAFARLQNDASRLGDVWLRVNRMTSAILAPGMLGLAVVAPDFVPVVFGSRWHAAVPVLQLLSLGGVSQALQVFNGPLYQARGRPGMFLRFMLFSTGVTFGGFVVGLHWGVVGVAASFAIARTVVLWVNTVLMCRTVDLQLGRTVLSYLEIIVISTAMAVVVYGARAALLDAGVSAGPRLIACVVLGTAVYLAVLAWRSPDLLVELRTTLRRG